MFVALMERTVIDHHFDAPVERVFSYFAEHENGNITFAPMHVERLNDGTDGSRNGVGSRRKLSLKGVLPFEETVTEVVPGQRIEYRITKGTPLNHHVGVMTFSSPAPDRTHLHYVIEFGAPVPGLAKVIAAVIGRGVRQSMPKAERAIANGGEGFFFTVRVTVFARTTLPPRGDSVEVVTRTFRRLRP